MSFTQQTSTHSRMIMILFANLPKAFADVLERVNEAGMVVVVGSQTAVEAANAERDGMFAVTKVL